MWRISLRKYEIIKNKPDDWQYILLSSKLAWEIQFVWLNIDRTTPHASKAYLIIFMYCTLNRGQRKFTMPESTQWLVRFVNIICFLIHACVCTYFKRTFQKRCAICVTRNLSHNLLKYNNNYYVLALPKEKCLFPRSNIISNIFASLYRCHGDRRLERTLMNLWFAKDSAVYIFW